MNIFSFIKWRIKNTRTRLLEFIYSKKPILHQDVLDDFTLEANKALVVVIAFERPSITDWQLAMLQKNGSDIHPIVFDNSRDLGLAGQIEAVCKKHHITYFKLPKNNVTHPNRGHGMAMNWIYKRFIQKINPKVFGFIDHDLIPLRAFSILDRVKNKPFYGSLYGGGKRTWQIWAGYSFFNYESIKDKNVDFMYDFEAGLDTGGRNYHSIFKNYPLMPNDYATNQWISFLTPVGDTLVLQVIDDTWYHIGGVSYNTNYIHKKDQFEKVKMISQTTDFFGVCKQESVQRISANVLTNVGLV